MDFLQIENETEEEFELIAEKLLNNFSIQAPTKLYRLIEIELYWNSSSHIDESTYQRKYVDPDQGEWFFHYSGVDIALKNKETGGYGGILIRSIQAVDQVKQPVIKGPMVCAMLLFSGTNAFEKCIQTQIIPHSFQRSTIIKKERVGLGKNGQFNGANKLNYNFSIQL